VAHLGEVQKHYDAIRQAGGEVLVVSIGTPRAAAMHQAERRWPFPLVVDPERRAYEMFGLERTTWGVFLRPGVIGGYLRQMLRGWLPHRPYEKSDLLQLGGDFVLDAGRRVVYAHPSTDPADRPMVEELVRAIHEAAGRQ
jgi:hypothetical protein